MGVFDPLRALRARMGFLRSRLRSDVEFPGPRRLRLTNRLGVARVAGGQGPVVTMTTYGERIPHSYLALESIARGTLRPSRLILLLDDEAAYRALPRELRRLRRRGLEIRLVENLGPHTKYFSYVADAAHFSGPLVMADDDVMYPHTWLARLTAEHERTPDHVICYRARRIVFDGDRLMPYAEWDFSQGAESSWLHFPTTVSGTLLPVPMLEALHRRGRAFVDQCPQADDVWMHHTALTTGIPIRLVDGTSRSFPLIDGTQDSALWYANVNEGRNDAQIARTYSADDIRALVDEAAEAGAHDGS